jgi:hypothetical protein
MVHARVLLSPKHLTSVASVNSMFRTSSMSRPLRRRASLLGINALRTSEAAAARIEDYAQSLRGHRVLHLIGKGNKPATMPITVPVLRVLEACRGQRTTGPLLLRPISTIRSTAATPTGWSPESRRSPASHATSAHTPRGTPPSPTPSTQAYRFETLRSWPGTPTHALPSITTAPAATSTGTGSTSWLPTSPASRQWPASDPDGQAWLARLAPPAVGRIRVCGFSVCPCRLQSPHPYPQ